MVSEAGEVDASGLVAGVLLASEERGLVAKRSPAAAANSQRQRPPPFGSVKSSKTTSSSPSEHPSTWRSELIQRFPPGLWRGLRTCGKLVYMRNQSLHPFVCGALLLRSVEREADEQGVAPKDAVHDRLEPYQACFDVTLSSRSMARGEPTASKPSLPPLAPDNT